MRKYDKGGPKKKKSIMFLDEGENKNQKLNLNLRNFRNVKNPDLMNALTIGGATFLGSSGIGSVNTATKQKKGKKSVYDQYIQDQGGQSFIDRCSTGDCPNMPYYNPDQKWFYNAADRAGDMYENLGYHTGSASAGTSNDFSAYQAVKQGEREGTILSKENLNKKYMQNISKGLKQGVIAGGTSYLLNKALDNTRFGRRLQNKLGMDINLGIYKQDGGQRAKEGGVKKYATAGMYNNTMPQGLANSTTNIVGAERNSAVLAQNQAGIQSVADNLQRKNEQLGSELAEDKSRAKQEQDEAAANVGKGTDQALGVAGKALKSEKGQSFLKNIFAKKAAPKITGSLSGSGTAASSLTTPIATAPTSQLLGATPGITAPSALSSGLSVPTVGGGIGGGGAFGGASLGADKLAANLGTGALTNAASGASKFAGFGKQGMEFAKLAQSGTKAGALAAGAGKFLTSGAGLGTVATLAGKGISKLSDDNRADRSNTGEYAGSILSAAGTGASFGSVIPGIGTAIGAGVGALYGAGKQYFGTQKAKKIKAAQDSKQRRKQEEYNATLQDQMGAQLTQARVGEMEQKTYSGYDMGTNVTYRLGGGRMQMPRYA